MNNVIGVYKIKIKNKSDIEDFKTQMKEKVFPSIGVGHQTRGGIVNSQALFQVEEDKFYWMVNWLEQGGSPFGSAGIPGDPKDKIANIEMETVYNNLDLIAEEPLGNLSKG